MALCYPRMEGKRLIALLALGFALVVPRAPWSDAPRAEPQRAAISRSGELGGADYLIEVPSVNPVYAERTGRLTVPLLTLHETGDAWVPLSLAQSYRRRTIAAGTAHLLPLAARR